MNETQKKQATPKGYIQTFIIVHLALVAGPILALLLTAKIPEEWQFNFPQGQDLLGYLPLIIGFGSVVVSELLYRQHSSKYSLEDGLQEKMSQLFTAYLIRFAILEAATFFCFFYLGTANHFVLLCGLIPVAVMFVIFPKKERIITALKLNREQKTQFMKMNDPIN